MWLPPSSAYTADDLLRVAHARDFKATKRLITDWVSIGLLDQPHRRGRGRGKGVERTWPERQLQLWLTLLDKRREVRHVASLCNIPVCVWLYWGVDYVPVRQVQRALGFFNRLLPGAPASTSLRNARRVVAQISAPNAARADKTALIEAMVDSAAGGTFSRDDMLKYARPVFDPDGSGRSLGPPGASMTAESWVSVTEATIVGARTIPTLDEDQFEEARLALNQMLQIYAQQQPGFARDPELGDIFDTPTPDWLVNNACSQLTLQIGYLELARRRGADEANTSSQPT